MIEKTASEFSGETEACREFDAGLQAHLEGQPSPAVSTHARECAFCGVVLSDLSLIQSASRELGHEEPSARLWGNIRAALAAENIFREPVSPWRRWFQEFTPFRQLAPIGALAALAVLTSGLLAPRGAFERAQLSIQQAGLGKAISGTPGRPAAVDAGLAQIVNDMETNYRARETSVEPAVRATYAKSLESLNTEIRECLDSLRREPSNTLAREYLMNGYEKKAELIAAALEFDAR